VTRVLSTRVFSHKGFDATVTLRRDLNVVATVVATDLYACATAAAVAVAVAPAVAAAVAAAAALLDALCVVAAVSDVSVAQHWLCPSLRHQQHYQNEQTNKQRFTLTCHRNKRTHPTASPPSTCAVRGVRITTPWRTSASLMSNLIPTFEVASRP
jgi:hypothetical protein